MELSETNFKIVFDMTEEDIVTWLQEESVTMVILISL